MVSDHSLAVNVSVDRVGNRSMEGVTMRRITWRLIPLLFLLYIVSFIDRTNVSFAALQMNRDLGFGAAVYGLGAGIFFLGYALFEVPSNLILARVGARRWISRIAITWGLLASAMLLVRNAESFYVLRFLLGVAEAGFFPGIIYYLGQWFPERQRARAISGFMLGVPISAMIGGPAAGVLLALDGTFGLAGWQWLFVVEGVPAVILGAIVLCVLTDRPEDAHWLSTPDRLWLRENLEAEQAQRGGVREDHLRRALAIPALWWLAVPYLVVGIGSYAAIFWGPTLVRDLLGLGEVAVGIAMGGIGLLGAIWMLINGRWSDRRDERVMHAAVPLLLSALGFVVAATRREPALVVGGLAVAIAGFYAFLPVFWCLPARFLGGTAAAGGIAFLNAVGSLGGFVGPNVLGVVKEATGSFDGGLFAMSTLTLGAGVAMLALRRVPVFGACADRVVTAGTTAGVRHHVVAQG